MKYLQLSVYYEKAFNSLKNINTLKSSNDILKVVKSSHLESHRWPYYLNERKFDVKNILVNHYLFQKLWVEENRIKISSKKNWYYEVVYHQIIKYKPEIIFISSDSFFNNNFLKKIRTDFKFIKKVILWQGVFISNHEQFSKFKHVDQVLTSSVDIASQLSDVTKAEHIYFAFDKNVLKKIPRVRKINEILFIGSIFLERNIHGDRAKLISQLIDEFESISINSNTNNYSIKNYLKNFFTKFARISAHANFDLTEELSFYKHMNKISKVDLGGNYFGIDQFEKLNQSLFILNKHLNNATSAANIRIFEAAGVGSCLISDKLKGLDQLLDQQNEIVTYKNFNELISKVNYLKLNPNKAIEIGRNAQKRILKDHTFDIRIKEFEYLITKNV